jgi:ferredoxin
LDVARTQCLDACPDGFKEASTDEITALLEKEKEASDLSEEQLIEIQEKI